MVAKVNILVNQGASFSQEFQLYDDDNNPLVVTHANNAPVYTAAAQMRKSYQALDGIDFTTSLSNGSLILSLSANATKNVTAGRYVWDSELTSNTDVVRIIEGIVTVKPEVTR
jgi:hypothetical protein